MNEKEIMYILDNIDIDEKDFCHLDIELNDIERKRIQKSYRKAITKKSSKVKGLCIACALIFIIFITPAISSPVMASNIPILSTIYEALGIYNEYKDYTTYIGQSIETSKYTYTIDNMIVTPHESLMAVKITSPDPIPRDHDEFIIAPKIGNIPCNAGSSEKYWLDDNNLVVIFKHDYEEKVPKKSTVKIDIESLDYRDKDTHGTFEFKADFDKSYKEFVSIPIKNTSDPDLDIKFKELNSSIMETKIAFEGYDYDNLELLLNIDGKLYGGLKSSSSIRFEQFDVNLIKNSKNISLCMYKGTYSPGESRDRGNLSIKTIKQPDFIESQNVSLLPYYSFLDGHKGEFYNLERNNTSIKVHYKGKESDIVSLSEMSAWYKGIQKSNFSKVIVNPNDKNDYTIEFDDIPIDKKIDIRFMNVDNMTNDYTLLDTIKIK